MDEALVLGNAAPAPSCELIIEHQFPLKDQNNATIKNKQIEIDKKPATLLTAHENNGLITERPSCFDMTAKYTSSQVRAALKANGLTVTGWARRHGFPVEAVYSVLSGKTQGTRGMAHQIALALRLKQAAPTEMEYLFDQGRVPSLAPVNDNAHQEVA